MGTAIQFAILALQYGPQAVKAGIDLFTHTQETVAALQRPEGPSAEDWTKLTARNDALLATLDAQVAKDAQDGV